MKPETRFNANKEALLKEAKIFGLAFLGDGATVKRMALMNILAMCADTLPITVSIQDCTKHMQDGGKKDASYIARMFEEEVNKFDPTRSFTDVFFFDGASNVQKAGQILMAKFPPHILLPWWGACCIPILFIHCQDCAH